MIDPMNQNDTGKTKGRNPVCEASGAHAWIEVPDDRRFEELLVWKNQIVWECERCPRRKYEGLDSNNDVAMRRYWAPPEWYYPVYELPPRSHFRGLYLRERRSSRRRRR
jgi:hypothetical protein